MSLVEFIPIVLRDSGLNLSVAVSGVYHSVSPKYLQSYLNEYAFRYNHRNDETPMIQLMLNRVVS